MTVAPLVTIGIPLYKSLQFVERIAGNIERIDYPNTEVIISDRHCHDDAVAILGSRFQHESRVRTIAETDGLTWVEHYNELLQQAAGIYFMWMPHDDEFPADYVSRLVAALEADAKSVLAYGRIERVDLNGRSLGPSLDHDPRPGREPWSPRVAVDLLVRRQTEEPFRGVFRRLVVAQAGLGIQPTEDNMSADEYWIFGLALRGPFRLVPGCSCRKAYYPMSTHARWGARHLRHIWNGRNVLQSYLELAKLEQRDASDCKRGVDRWFWLGIAGVLARHCYVPAALRRKTQRALSRLAVRNQAY